MEVTHSLPGLNMDSIAIGSSNPLPILEHAVLIPTVTILSMMDIRNSYLFRIDGDGPRPIPYGSGMAVAAFPSHPAVPECARNIRRLF
jgi:hypothetical protein